NSKRCRAFALQFTDSTLQVSVESTWRNEEDPRYKDCSGHKFSSHHITKQKTALDPMLLCTRAKGNPAVVVATKSGENAPSSASISKTLTSKNKKTSH
ncbi:hypothetical protein SK128_006528, partial [Halocaridina rubra]